MRLLSPIPPTANVRIITGLKKIAFLPDSLQFWLVFGKDLAIRIATRFRSKMESDAVLKITPDMSEDEIIQACAEVVFENSPDPIQKQLEAAASEQGYGNALGMIKADIKEERDQHDTLEGWLASLPGRIS